MSNLNRLKELANSVDGAHKDFVIGVALIAKEGDIIDEAIAFIEDNPTANTDQVLDFLDDSYPPPPIEIVDE